MPIARLTSNKIIFSPVHMHPSYSIVLLVLSTAVVANPFEPQSRDVLPALTKRTVSPDQSCSGFDGYICPDSQCCSQFGWW